jgi:isocitrate/isopropylmalate dehydrogenase
MSSWAGAMMLEHLGLPEAAAAVLGATTTELGKAIASEL